MSDEQKYTAPALEKGLDILDVLSSHDHGLTQAEIARALNRSVSEIFRMIAVLRRRGLVDLEQGGDRYYLTTKLFEMASRTPILTRLTVAAGAIMRQIAHETDESVQLAVLSEGKTLVIGQVDNPGYNVLSVRLGARIDAWQTSSGMVILANLRPDDLVAFLTDYPHPDGTDKAVLAEELAQIKAQGYELRPSHVVKGVTNISVPIMGHERVAVAAMTIPYIDRHFSTTSLDDCRGLLMIAAENLSKAIGGSGQPPVAD